MKTPPNHKMKSGESETISINPQKTVTDNNRDLQVWS